jgi:hypothetical protein
MPQYGLFSLAINTKPHMAILAQAHEMQLMDYGPNPAQPVRIIGEPMHR